MSVAKPVNLWTSAEHARDYLERADSISHRSEGEATLLEFIPATTRRILDLGTGDGRLLALVRDQLARLGASKTEAVAVDFSPAMLEEVRKRFAADGSVRVVAHNLDDPLPALGKFDAVVSSFAIHHLVHERKRALYQEISGMLNPGGVFCNLEHVASPTPHLHEEFLHGIGYTSETEDRSNKLLDVETQLGWLRETGFVDVDCHWKWRELALLAGRNLSSWAERAQSSSRNSLAGIRDLPEELPDALVLLPSDEGSFDYA
jgi:tRNA (cmo5U34)-methyltransferase